MEPRTRIHTVIVFLMTMLTNSAAQVSVAPSMLFIDPATGIGNLYIRNTSTVNQEVNISFLFGYAGSDTAGNLVMVYNDSAAAAEYSLTDYLRAFPKSFILKPQQDQTVRLQVRGAQKLRDRQYFTRVKVTSAQQSTDAGDTTAAGVKTKVNFVFDQIIAAFYRKGKPALDVALRDVAAATKDSTLMVTMSIAKSGNGVFLGSITGTLYNSSGEEVDKQSAATAVYFTAKRRLAFNVARLPRGEYRLELNLESNRADVAKKDNIQIVPVTTSIVVNR